MAPSLQLLKPTASSLGHRVAKVTHSPDLISNKTQVKSYSRSYLLNAESPKEYQFCRSLSTGCTDNDATKARSLTTDCSFRVESINRVETSSLDPFRNICLSSNTSMDDEEMEHIGNDNERQAMQYDAIPTGLLSMKTTQKEDYLLQLTTLPNQISHPYEHCERDALVGARDLRSHGVNSTLITIRGVVCSGFVLTCLIRWLLTFSHVLRGKNHVLSHLGHVWRGMTAVHTTTLHGNTNITQS